MNLKQFMRQVDTGAIGGAIAIAQPLVAVRSAGDKHAAELLLRFCDEHPTMTYHDVEQVLLTALFWLQLWGTLEYAQGEPEVRNGEPE